MQINGVNHINIITGDLPATCAFYEDLFGMTIAANPFAMPGFDGRWICDSQGNAIVHVQGYNPERHGELKRGMDGALDHVSLTCVGFAEVKQRCSELGIACRVNDREYANLRQVFVTDPNGVSLELNFPGD